MGIFGLIPARGGSKAIPHKNVALCGGLPLIAHTCRAALAAKSLQRTILSTDDAEIAKVARAHGIEAPFTRPADLATDESPMLGVMQHALSWLEQDGARVTALMLLQPTSPLRTASQLDEAVELFERSAADTVVSVVEVPHNFNPTSVLSMAADGLVTPYLESAPQPLRRQDKPRVFARNGPAILLVRAETLRAGKLYGSRTQGYLMDRASSLDVDTADDLELCEYLLKKRGLSS